MQCFDSMREGASKAQLSENGHAKSNTINNIEGVIGAEQLDPPLSEYPRHHLCAQNTIAASRNTMLCL